MSDRALQKLAEYLKKLTKNKFFGEVRIKFQDGKIVHIEEEKSVDIKQFND